ncbi:sugar phosphate isomerase/epimerase family protein [Halomonas maura]|uniref:sugar phosphate isomerase/epimerase family protein n=1 Tax=Halomonas maura TaxID=117606 RepID=UPI0025B42B43|nr:TIM barrel protein [Halomonas maura]MDN3557850.1 TIM barrel protein [Halomonas maura]
MSMRIASAPCCWGVDDVTNPHLPPWRKVLDEAAEAGYQGVELGPYGYLPLDVSVLGQALDERGLKVVAGTIFDDLVDPANRDHLIQQTHEICAFLNRLPAPPREPGQHHSAPYLVLIDHVHAERSRYAGHPDRAPRLNDARWATLMTHIRTIAELASREYGIRAMIHPHAGGYIEFDDEIRRLLADIPYTTAGLCLDTGHLYYSGMDPVAWLRDYAGRTDYLHFKDIAPTVFEEVMAEQVDFFAACARGVMCPIGQGVVDYDAIYRRLVEIGYQGYITIEQERDPRDADGSLADVTASLEYLKRRGFQADV